MSHVEENLCTDSQRHAAMHLPSSRTCEMNQTADWDTAWSASSYHKCDPKGWHSEMVKKWDLFDDGGVDIWSDDNEGDRTAGSDLIEFIEGLEPEEAYLWAKFPSDGEGTPQICMPRCGEFCGVDDDAACICAITTPTNRHRDHNVAVTNSH